MKNEPVITEKDYAKHENFDIELKAEVFEKPIAKTDSKFFYTRISFTDVETESPWGVKYLLYENELNEDQIEAQFEFIKQNIANYVRK